MGFVHFKHIVQVLFIQLRRLPFYRTIDGCVPLAV